ncbi:MAG: alpha/beta fold hydrolase [Planctomycetota bacterium]
MHVSFPGPAGRLEGLLEAPADLPRGPRAVAVLAPPHPLHGGSMKNSILHRAARALRAAGLVTLRIDFRGVGRSEGTHDGNGAEEEDVAAALDELAWRHPGRPAWGVGYSFGAWTVANLAARSPRFARLVLIAFPLEVYDASVLAALSVPTLLVLGAEDPFGTARALARRVPALPPHVRVEEVPGADHLFRGVTPGVEEAVRVFAAEANEVAP